MLGISQELTIVLAGTGGPELTPERSGIATLVRFGEQALLFDAGRGTLDSLYKARIEPQTVTRVFLTHLHNDHIEGLPTLWITPWFLLGRTAPLEVWGPEGTRAMIAGMRQMFAHDVDLRANQALRREFLDIQVHEIAAGTVYSRDGIEVTAVTAEHHEGNPAFAYRVSAGGHSVFLTGDTTLTPGITAAANGVDLLISNVAAGTRALEASGSINPILAKLMRPEQAGELFRKAAPRLAVFSHIVKKGLPGTKGDREIVRRTGYSGGLVMGADGMTIRIGSAVRVEAPKRRNLPDFDRPGAKFP